MRYAILQVLILVALGTPLEKGVGQLDPSAGSGKLYVRADSRLWLEGSSNVRDWTCRATRLDAAVEVENNATGIASGEMFSVQGATVSVPVRSLKCGDRHMEAHIYSALKSPASAPGSISAVLDGLPVTGFARTIEVTGTLTIAGVQRRIAMMVQGDRLPDGTIRARGSLPILMTDFGITPPRPWGGILRTANKVLIQFEIFVDPPA